MENHESINISTESINNLIFESLRHVRDQKKESIYQQSLHIYIKKDGSIITDRITYLTNKNALENKRSNNKDPYYLKHNKRPRGTL